MPTNSGNTRNTAEQHFDEIETQLKQLRDLLLDPRSGALNSSGPSDDDDDPRAVFEDAVVRAFGQWVLDFLDPGGDDISDMVRRARRQFIGALSLYAPRTDVRIPDDDPSLFGQGQNEDEEFEDLFADEPACDEELGVLPVQFNPESE